MSILATIGGFSPWLPEDSFILHNWSTGGESIDWRHAFDPLARRRFHDLGGTGENWWRQE
jgi:hypothetical protein